MIMISLKQHIHQTDRTIAQLKKENEELQQKVTNCLFNRQMYFILKISSV